MTHRFIALCSAVLMSCMPPLLQAREGAGPGPGLAVTVDVSHVGKDKWRVDYRFSQPVTAVKLASVGEDRHKAWKMLTAGVRLKADPEFDIIASDGKPFRVASVEIDTFDGRPEKQYAPFNRFSDGGTAVFLGHLQGEASRGKQTVEMSTDIRLHGLLQENVIAAPLNKLAPGGQRGYAYFGPDHAVPAGPALVLLDANAPPWVRETVLDVGEKMAQYYEKTYQRSLKEKLFIMLSVSEPDVPGFSVKGGMVLGQLSYRVGGNEVTGEHPKKRYFLAKVVAHEMAHIWQMNVDRGGIGPRDPWIYEGGAEAMALEGMLQTGVASQETVAAYRAGQAATCEKLGDSVASFNGIYACGLMRFDRLGIGIVPLWRAMMEATEVKGEVYSQEMIDAIVRESGNKHL